MKCHLCLSVCPIKVYRLCLSVIILKFYLLSLSNSHFQNKYLDLKLTSLKKTKRVVGGAWSVAEDGGGRWLVGDGRRWWEVVGRKTVVGRWLVGVGRRRWRNREERGGDGSGGCHLRRWRWPHPLSTGYAIQTTIENDEGCPIYVSFF
ncbi:hypothetical protein Hdeb2414_s0003g00091821 [Helianthus debilis subsp. tardiflorus]